MKLEKTRLRGYHFFYIAFFAGYFFFLYFLLYSPSDLSPFQINIHFFSNVIGSLSKRFMAEAAPYAFLFALIQYSRRRWLRIVLIAFFLVLFFLNCGIALYYFVTHTNLHWYIIRGFKWQLFFSYLHGHTLLIFLGILGVMSALVVTLYRLPLLRPITLKKKLGYFSLFGCLAIIGNFVPILYNNNLSIFSSDRLQKKQYQLMDLDHSGIVGLANAFRSEYFPPDPKKQPLTDEEKAYIAEMGLETKLTLPSDFRPKKVVLILLENVNQSFLSFYNSEIPGTTPFVDSLIRENPHVDAFYPSGTYTLYGLSSILCSHLNTARMLNDSTFSCLPNSLKNSGYWTEFIRGFSKYYVHENVFFEKIGFDAITAQEEFEKKFPDFPTSHPALYNSWGYSDDYVFNEAIERLKEKNGKKVFLTLLTVDTHPNGGRCYRDRTSADPGNDVLFSTVCTDENLKHFFDELKAQGLFDDDLLVILTTDHLYSGFSQVPGDLDSDTITALPGRIPLVFISKKPATLLAQQGSQIDIAPTLLDLLDIEAPSGFMGRSLIANSNPAPMGKDLSFAYILLNNEFFGFDLMGNAAVRQQGVSGNFLALHSSNLEELEREIDRLRRERDQAWTTDSSLLKWLKNQLY